MEIESFNDVHVSQILISKVGKLTFGLKSHQILLASSKRPEFNKILILRLFNIVGYDKNFNYKNNNYPLQRIFPIFKK